jgi:hypothetical protein
MVRALLEGRKTQTRRVLKPQPAKVNGEIGWVGIEGMGYCPIKDEFSEEPILCPYGKIGDRLWVRENLRVVHYGGQITHGVQHPNEPSELVYAADDVNVDGVTDDFWATLKRDRIPSTRMPRWASRIALEIAGVRVERLNDISEADAKAEGCDAGDGLNAWEFMNGAPAKAISKTACAIRPHALSYYRLWESINGKDSWAANPWVWVVEFKVIKKGGAA